MSIESIPVRVMAPDSGLSGNAWPLMMEIAEMVRTLVDTGDTAAIDLSALPLTPADKDWLKERLGSGQIHVTLDAEGLSTLDETACPGVWWITHLDGRDRVMAEFIEVTLVPDLVKAHPEDIKIGLEYLEGVISQLS
ncbi:MAG: hydrogenase expression/formation protein [Thiobacillus sp.]|nr:hydrogenase expression/formation protein [Thiobacillus sp.]